MKQIYTFPLLACLLSLCGACTQSDSIPADNPNEPFPRVAYKISTRILPMEGELVQSGTRALQPMTPEEENMIRTIAVLQFDSEDNLVPVSEPTQKEQFYYFKDLTEDEDTPNGALSPDLDGVILQQSDKKTTVCLIANLSENQVEELTLKDDGKTRVLLSDFRQKTVQIENMLTAENGAGGNNQNIGHVKNIYMFGYYEGVLPSGDNNKLSIDLGRIIARIEVNFILDNPQELTKKFYISLANLETRAYVFPGTQSPNADDSWLKMTPTERSQYIKDGSSQFYFYAAPHSADNPENATQLQIWYTDTNEADQLEEKECHTILLCNNPDVEAEDAMAGDYYLNRNSIYHVNVHLTKKTKSQKLSPATRSTDRETYTYTIELP